MCGILGQITFSDGHCAAPGEEISSRLIGLMARRGPDDEGFWSDGKYCLFAFRRRGSSLDRRSGEEKFQGSARLIRRLSEIEILAR